MNIIEANNIHKSYGNKFNKQEVLKGININVKEGEILGIMGASGSGKTTLLNALSSIKKISEGIIKFDGIEISSMKEKHLAGFRKKQLGFIFQDSNLLRTLTVKENVLLPLSIAKIPYTEANQKFEVLTKQLGIFELKDKYPNEIPREQIQLSSLAQAIIHEPKVVFADEPTGNLDSIATINLLNKLVKIIKKRNVTFVIVTHDPEVASYCNRIIFIKDGQTYTQLYRGEESRTNLFKDILQIQRLLSEV
ncbi:bacitracin ABC transporter ATP-binding protein [Priestia aryabhattai]|uniref:ABC transporter ATP-binding protein n=1 Tax=Priestia TaxID=2800373 RepID=UPI000B50CA33|nr:MULTISPECIES: ABC transporter ATP-binding protein [Priestia]MBZ6484796.1 ABC transporter ATP-binding protein [Priestia aryabhattai]OVE34110.1 bacitracin ABC transporter ATP-binding protein [Priestia aryabhattai]PAK44090.1 ABC transporter ATP-binding protein [Priestia megaterium]